MKDKLPEPILNIYRDLRDRRLLPIVIALLVAIIAVPFLLGGDDAATPVSSAALEGSTPPVEGADQIDPVVLADVPGLRNFHERLDRYKSRNPFKQQLTPKTAQGGGPSGSNQNGGLPTQSSSSSSSTTSGTTAATDQPTTAPTATDPSTTPATKPGDSNGNGNEAGSGTELITYRIDVRIGRVGNTKVERDVKPLSLLPDKKHAVVQYVDSNTHGTAAGFVVNPEATAVKGDGHCSKSRSRCHFLLLKPGEEMYFLLGDGHTYRLELKKIDEHREPYDPKADASKGSGRATFSSSVGAR